MSGRDPILVGIDGTSEGLRAAEYAVLEARARGNAPLVLLHVYREQTQINPMMPVYGEESEHDVARRSLAEAERHVAGLAPDLDVSTRLEHGSFSRHLAHAATGAQLVVIGRTPLSGLDRLMAGSAGSHVAAHTPVPLVSVPMSWRDEPERSGVVVGADPSHSGPVLDWAFAEAARLGTPLVAVRSWEPPSLWSSEGAMSETTRDNWLIATDTALADDLEVWQDRYPEVTVDRQIALSSPSAALVSRSNDARLVVIGSRRGAVTTLLGLGSTARAVLAHASCPVAVIPLRRAEEAESTRHGQAPDFTLPLY